MKIAVRRITSLVTLVLVVGTSMAQGVAPALAAGAKFYVGTCHAGGLPDLYAAVTAVNALPASDHKTVILCPGTHTVTIADGALNFMTSNLKIMGKKGAVVTTDPGYNGSTFNMSVGDKVAIQHLTIRTGPGYGGNLVDFSSVTNARVLKVVIDGQGDVASSSAAIFFFNSGGKIIGNKILNWHSIPYDGGHMSTAIDVSSPFVTGNTVRITGNTIDSYEGVGISAQFLAGALITGNKITSVHNVPAPAGIIAILIGLLTDGKISGNQITGGAYPASNGTAGIKLVDASNTQVSGNKLSHWDRGIQVSAGCAPDSTANNLTIKGNKIQGVVLLGIDVVSGGVGCDTFADNLVVTGNKMTNSGSQGAAGISVYVGTDGSHFGYARNVKIKGNHIVNFLDGVLPLSLNPPYLTGVIGPNF